MEMTSNATLTLFDTLGSNLTYLQQVTKAYNKSPTIDINTSGFKFEVGWDSSARDYLVATLRRGAHTYRLSDTATCTVADFYAEVSQNPGTYGDCTPHQLSDMLDTINRAVRFKAREIQANFKAFAAAFKVLAINEGD